MNQDQPPSSPRYDPAEMALRGRIGAFRLHATHDPKETTRKAREKFLQKFIDEVDPDRVLPEEERLRRATCARRAHFARLARLSGRARRRRDAKEASKRDAASDEAPMALETRCTDPDNSDVGGPAAQ